MILVIPAYKFGWLELTVFVSLLSLWALVETAFAAWRADENPEIKRVLENQNLILEKLDDLTRKG